MTKYKSFTRLFLSLAFSLLLLPQFALAAATVEPPQLEVPIPGMPAFQRVVPQGQDITSSWIAEYIVGVYRYGIGLLGITAMIAIAVGGAMIVVGGDAKRIGDGWDWVKGGVTGLALGLGSYMILNMINTDLVNFKAITVTMTKDIDQIDGLDVAKGGSDSEAGVNSTTRACVPNSEIITLNASTTGCDSFTASNPQITKRLADSLKIVCEKAHQKNLKINISSAYRSLEHQTRLFNAAVSKYGSEAAARQWVAKPSCNAPHVAGVAIDAKPIPETQANIQLMQQVFKDAGWGRYCPEWWHFQAGYDKAGANC